MVRAARTLPIGGLDVTTTSLLWSVVAILVTALVARYAARATRRLGDRVEGIPHDLALQASRVVRYLVIVVGAGVVLAILGAPIQPVIAALLIIGAAGLLMARGIADNFGAGLVIQARHPVRLGDVVESCGYVGRVTDLNSRTVVLETADGRTVHIPNRQFMDNPLVNASSRGGCRAELQVRVPADSDAAVQSVSRLLTGTASETHGVLPSPRPLALLVSAEPGRAVLLLQFWHEPGLTSTVSSRVADAVHRALTEDGRLCAVVWPAPAPPLIHPGEL